MNDMLVEKPQGPDSHRLPSASTVTSGLALRWRCGSTTVAGANFAFQVEYDGFGVTVVGFRGRAGAADRRSRHRRTVEHARVGVRPAGRLVFIF